jgi:hypothetical protein
MGGLKKVSGAGLNLIEQLLHAFKVTKKIKFPMLSFKRYHVVDFDISRCGCFDFILAMIVMRGCGESVLNTAERRTRNA